MPPPPNQHLNRADWDKFQANLEALNHNVVALCNRLDRISAQVDTLLPAVDSGAASALLRSLFGQKRGP